MEAQEMQTVDYQQFIVIKFDLEQFGINIQYITNIIRMSRITRVPNAPYYIKGVINLRGEIIPVMSTRLKFGLKDDEITDATRIIIVNMENHAIGLMVDEVLEVIQLTEDQIDKIKGDTSEEASKYVYAVGKLGEELVTLLNIEELISVES